MTQPPDEKPCQPVTRITTDNSIQRIARFSVPNPNVPDLELIFDKRSWGRLRVRWCLAASPISFARSVRLCKGSGCRACRQTGYRGRTGIYEVMVTGDAIREMCVQRLSAVAIRNQAIKEGMITLRQDGWRKVLNGTTTIDEVARVTAGDIVS
jgi:hypothetical protein